MVGGKKSGPLRLLSGTARGGGGQVHECAHFLSQNEYICAQRIESLRLCLVLRKSDGKKVERKKKWEGKKMERK